MKAGRWYERKRVSVDEVAEPTITAPTDVKIRTICSGICGTDLHEYLEGPVYISTAPHPLTGMKPPITLGHESVGIVSEVGSSVTRVAVGDRVCFYPVLSCRECEHCRSGNYHYCAKMGFIGIHSDGFFAEHCVVPEYSCIPVPSGVPDEAAALTEPAAMVVRAVDRAGIRAGDCVAIVGAGPIGLIAVQVARILGAARVVVFETLEARKKKAVDLGADTVIDPTKENPVSAVRSFSSGSMCDVAVECVGSESALALCTEIVRPSAHIMVVGIHPTKPRVDMFVAVNSEFTIRGTMGGGGYFATTLDYVDTGRLDLSTLVSADVPLQKLPDELEEITSHRERFLKVIVRPTTGA